MIKNFFWSFFQQGAGQLLNLIITVFLARLVSPEDFGLMALTYVFYIIAERLMESGMGESFIITKDAKPIDFNTIFFTIVFLSFVFYGIIFFVAPYVADFYNIDQLVLIIRVNSISIILLALNSIQTHHLWKELKLKETTIISLVSIVLGGALGIIAAYHHYGVWSLVITNLGTNFIRLILTIYYSIWQPRFMFSFQILKKHYSFGIKLTITNLIDALFRNSYTLIIGKRFSANIIGQYNRADSTKNILSTITHTSISKVIIPYFSKINEDENYEDKVLELFNIVFYAINFIIFFIILVAIPLFTIVFSEVWQVAADYFKIVCFATIFYSIYSLNTDLLKIGGYSNVVLKTELIRKSIEIVAVLVALYFSIEILLYVLVIISIVNFLINSFFVEKYLKISQKKQLFIVSPTIIIGLFSYLFSHYLLGNFSLNDFLYILIGFVIFTFIFVLLSIFFNAKPLKLAIKALKSLTHKNI